MEFKFETSTGAVPVPDGRTVHVAAHEDGVTPYIKDGVVRFYNYQTQQHVMQVSGVIEVMGSNMVVYENDVLRFSGDTCGIHVGEDRMELLLAWAQTQIDARSK